MPQVILITGASSGLGKATAELLVSKGHIVYGTSRNSSGSLNGINLIQLDITDNESVINAIDLVIRIYN